MKRLLIALGTAYLLWKIADELLEQVDAERMLNYWIRNFPKDMLDTTKYRSWADVKRDLGWDIDEAFDELHATPGYWEKVKRQHAK